MTIDPLLVHLERAKTRLLGIVDEDLNKSWHNDVIEDAIMHISEAIDIHKGSSIDSDSN